MEGVKEKKTWARVHIRWMIRRDMQSVVDIEKMSFDLPWGEEEFIAQLRSSKVIGMVAEIDERVIGYMVYSLSKENLTLLNMAVHPSFRGKRVACQMINLLKGKLGSHRRIAIDTVVRETNLNAQLFLKSQSFLGEKVLRRHFGDSGEDGFTMRYEI